MSNQNRDRVSYSLEPEYQELFKKITKKTRRNMTDELRLMLDARAMAIGLEPVNEIDPNLSGLTLEKGFDSGRKVI